MHRQARLATSLILVLLSVGTLEARESHTSWLNRKGLGLKEHTNKTLGDLGRSSVFNSTLKQRAKEKKQGPIGNFGIQSLPSKRNTLGKQATAGVNTTRPEKTSKLKRESGRGGPQQRAQPRDDKPEVQLQAKDQLETLEGELTPVRETQTAGTTLTTGGQAHEALPAQRRVSEQQPSQALEDATARAKKAEEEAAKAEAERQALANLELGKLDAERMVAEGKEAERLQRQEMAELEAKAQESHTEAQLEPWPEAEEDAEEDLVSQEEPWTEPDEDFVAPLRSKKLDIVIAHYYPQRIASMRDFWLWFFNLETVKVWKPYVFIYTQSHDEVVINELRPFIIYGGQIVRLDNAGRESHVYLQHISRHYNDLARHTLFAQDEPNTDLLPKKFERMFVEQTGYLPLSFMGHVDCFEVWNDIIPAKVIPQLYGMLTHELCPPTGYAAGFEGQFLVSRDRILGQPLVVYRHLMDMVAAPTEHWVHEYHEVQDLKDQSNPYMGHALERSWSLAFNCYEVWRQMNCYDCEQNKNMEACGRDACQCYDID